MVVLASVVAVVSVVVIVVAVVVVGAVVEACVVAVEVEPAVGVDGVDDVVDEIVGVVVVVDVVADGGMVTRKLGFCLQVYLGKGLKIGASVLVTGTIVVDDVGNTLIHGGCWSGKNRQVTFGKGVAHQTVSVLLFQVFVVTATTVVGACVGAVVVSSGLNSSVFGVYQDGGLYGFFGLIVSYFIGLLV